MRLLRGRDADGRRRRGQREAGRLARAWVAESQGLYKPQWSLEDVAANIAAIRTGGEQQEFTPVPDGQLDHLMYGFAMARAGGA